MQWRNLYYAHSSFLSLGETMPTPTKPFVLVDGSSYLYRAFHALPALMNSKGFPTGAVYGLVNMLKRLLADFHPDYLAVVFDAKGKTFRDELYPAYKATRHAMPPELVQQIKPIHDIIRAMGLPILMIEGVEADDVIGTLAQQAAKQGHPVLISTGDKDLTQLVTSQVTLINTMTNSIYTPESVKEKFGVPPEGIIDYLTLVGDTSDNIPGVPKVGPKTAAKWLQEYQTLDQLIHAADKIPGKVGENLRAFLAQIPLTKTLVTIKLDVEIPTHWAELKIQPANTTALIDLFKEMEFKTWLKEALETTSDQKPPSVAPYTLIQTEKALQEWINTLEKSQQFAFSTHTDSQDYMKASLVGLAFALEDGKTAYIPFSHQGMQTSLAKAHVLEQLKPILENSHLKKIGHNLKYDLEILASQGITLRGVAFDIMLASYILESTSNSHDRDSLTLKYLGLRTLTAEEVMGKGSKQIPFSAVDVQQAGAYAAADIDATLKLHAILSPRIEKEPGLSRIFTEIEMPLLTVLANMERTGVLIDPELLKQQGKDLQARLNALEKEAYQLADGEFNMNSPKQLQEILFQKLKLPILQKTPTGQASTADNVLQELALDFTLPRLIIEYRSLSKLISTYTSRLVEQINPATGRIHTSYNQTGAATGRLSSSEPNLQNIPIRTPEGKRIRQAFIAPKGYKIISADYSQIELRLMAHISNDSSLLNAFINNLDIHRATASEVWEVPLEKVTADMRRNAKAINFGLIYGMSAFGLTRQLNIDRKAAEDYIQRYFARYPQVKRYMDDTRLQAKKTGYVETLWGRRLYLPDINASQLMRQRAAERAAINAPLQGSAADIIKLAMIKIDRWLQEEKIDARMIMQVHDELVFEAAEKDLEAITAAIRHYMTEGIPLKVPLLVTLGVGNNWNEASDH